MMNDSNVRWRQVGNSANTNTPGQGHTIDEVQVSRGICSCVDLE